MVSDPLRLLNYPDPDLAQSLFSRQLSQLYGGTKARGPAPTMRTSNSSNSAAGSAMASGVGPAWNREGMNEWGLSFTLTLVYLR